MSASRHGPVPRLFRRVEQCRGQHAMPNGMAALTDIRVETLKRYGIETALAPRFPDPAAR